MAMKSRAEVVREALCLLLESSAAAAAQATRINRYAQQALQDLASGRAPGELGLPLAAGSDLAVAAGIVIRHGGKVDMAIEQAYYASEAGVS